MPLLKLVDGAVVEYGVTTEMIGYLYGRTSFPANYFSTPGVIWAVPDVYSESNTTWISYIATDASNGSIFKSESLPTLNPDGYYHSSINDSLALREIVYSPSTSSIQEGDKVDLQTITFNLSSPAAESVNLDLSIAPNYVESQSYSYDDSWIKLMSSSITINPGDTSFEIPILVRGNIFYDAQPRYFDLKITSSNSNYSDGITNPYAFSRFYINEDDAPPSKIEVVGGQITNPNISMSTIQAKYTNVSFMNAFANGSFYGLIGPLPDGAMYANVASWSPDTAPEGFQWVLDDPKLVPADNLNVTAYIVGNTQPYGGVVYGSLLWNRITGQFDDATTSGLNFYQQSWKLIQNSVEISIQEESAYNASPVMNGTNDSDAIIAAGTNNIIDAGNGKDLVLAGWGSDSVLGGAGNDVIYGEGGNDQINGGTGDDYLYAGTGNDVVDGGDGNDLIIGGDGAGNDTYIGGSGVDTVKYTSATAGITVNLAVGTATSRVGINTSGIGNDTLSEIENVIAGNFDDLLTGDTNDNTFKGYAGIDTIDGGVGSDTADYSDKTLSVVVALNGSTTVSVKVNGIIEDSIKNIENLIGGSATDTLTGDLLNNTLDGGLGSDTMTGGKGNDIYYVDNSGDKVVESTSAGTDEVRSSISYTLLTNFENLALIGTSNINGTGNSVANTITGNSGNNLLNGGTGADSLIGAAGNDTYVIDNIGDFITELTDEGTDTVQSSVSVSGLLADDATTAYIGSYVENILLTGTSAINATGNALNNTITGNSGANILKGGDGADTLIGGLGKDTLYGNSGNDIFKFNLIKESVIGTSRDVIADFTSGDKIDLSAIDAKTGGTSNDTFVFLGATAPTLANANGAIWFVGGILYGSTDADIASEFEIAVTGLASMSSGDFIL